MELYVDNEKCIRCGKCMKVCPAVIFRQEKTGSRIELSGIESCIVCGHCVAVCPSGAVNHGDFPTGKVHRFDYAAYPSPEQMMLLCKARRSNRAFSSRPVPEGMLSQILEVAHRAPTASNAQQVEFTVVTDPAKLRLLTEFTLGIFGQALKKMKNPLLRPLLKAMMPGALHYVPVFERLIREYAQGDDPILRRATAVVLIHTPLANRFGCTDANLAYENGSLMAECLGVSQFYTGFICAAIAQDGKGNLEKALGISGKIQAGMALGMPAFRYENYIDRKNLRVKRL